MEKESRIAAFFFRAKKWIKFILYRLQAATFYGIMQTVLLLAGVKEKGKWKT
ncbi:MAG: hypothetical protein IIW27_04410 [Clostridia bacterium]|nr:hypothetical protein [Clostridia bacterium]